MFVTSDIFDLEAIGRWRGFAWQENLLSGVGVHGTKWRGYQTDAAFLLEAARRCDLLSEMKWAGYSPPDDRRARSIKPASFERLARGELAGAKGATGVLLRGERMALGAQGGDILFGGDTSGSARRARGRAGGDLVPDYPHRAFDADFISPLTANRIERACELLRLSVDMLGTEYGYHFVRDDLCQPWMYTWGVGPALDAGPLSREETREISNWRDFVGSGQLWTGRWPLLRDLFEINLLSDRHASVRIDGLGYLTEWITAEAGRGRIEDIGDGRRLWILTDQEIFDVRPILNDAGLLLSCRDRVYRDLSPGTGVKPSAAPWCYASR